MSQRPVKCGVRRLLAAFASRDLARPLFTTRKLSATSRRLEKR